MKTILLINSVLNYGSTGKIVEQISATARGRNWNSWVAHGVKYQSPTQQQEFLIGNKWETYKHEAFSLLWDRQGLGAKKPTRELVRWISEINPDVIHLHNIHNYYLNYPILFDYLKKINTPVVWTFHDCWPFTGHCTYFDMVGCEKWRFGCGNCPGLKVYPRSLLFDRSRKNFQEKERCFTAISDRLTIVPVSKWLEGFIKQSFLKTATIKTIHNGIDLNIFCPKDTSGLKNKLEIGDKTVVIGVALPWTPRKGLNDMYKLAELLPKDSYQIVVVGLSEKQYRECPKGVMGVQKTNSASELAEYYSLATVFVNPTYEDNYPTTNLEAMACGTPVITYNTGGSPEAVTADTGWVVNQGDVKRVADIIMDMGQKNRDEVLAQRQACRIRAEQEFDKNKCFEKYVDLYEELLSL